MLPSLEERQAGQNRVDTKHDLRKVGVAKRGKKDQAKKPKRAQKGNKNRCKLCEELGHRIGSPKCRYTPESPKYVLFLFLTCLILLFVLVTDDMTCCYVFPNEACKKRPTSCC